MDRSLLTILLLSFSCQGQGELMETIPSMSVGICSLHCLYSNCQSYTYQFDSVGENCTISKHIQLKGSNSIVYVRTWENSSSVLHQAVYTSTIQKEDLFYSVNLGTNREFALTSGSNPDATLESFLPDTYSGITSEVAGSWWRVDLGHIYFISGVRTSLIFVPPEQPADAIIGVRVAPTVSALTEAVSLCGFHLIDGSSDLAVISCDGNHLILHNPIGLALPGRYIQVSLYNAGQSTAVVPTKFEIQGYSYCAVSNISETDEEIMCQPEQPSYKFSTLLARGKTATQSSTASGCQCSAGMAVDGDYTEPAVHVQHTLTEYQPWWKVDLMLNYFVAGVMVRHRNVFFERFSDVTFHVAKDEAGLRENYNLCAFQEGPIPSVMVYYPCTKGQFLIDNRKSEFVLLGRYVQIKITRDASDSILHMVEVEVHGYWQI